MGKHSKQRATLQPPVLVAAAATASVLWAVGAPVAAADTGKGPNGSNHQTQTGQKKSTSSFGLNLEP
jgi:hypothetical protein